MVNETLQVLRHRRGLSQFELGLRMAPPVHPRTVARWESGRNFPNGKRVVQLAHLLGTTAEELLRQMESAVPDGKQAS